MLDLLDVEGDVLRLAEQRLSLCDGRLKLGQRRHRQARKIARLIDQTLRLVVQHLDLVVDLLQLTRGREHALRVVVGIEHDPLRGGRRRGDDERKGDGACPCQGAELFHGEISRFERLGMRSAAQARSRSVSQASTKASRPCSARSRSIAA